MNKEFVIFAPVMTDIIQKSKEQIQQAHTLVMVDHQPDADYKMSHSLQPYFHNTMIDIFNEHDIDYQNKTMSLQHYMFYEDFNHVVINMERNWFLYCCRQFLKHMPTWSQIPQDSIEYNLNYPAGVKDRPHRSITAMILANIETNIRHSYSGHLPIDICKALLDDCDYNFDYELRLPKKYFPLDSNVDEQIFSSTTYENIYKHTALSIIPETNFRERGFGPTEKTLQAIYAGTFMIWVGSWRSAEIVEKIGFDVFHDVIDHSYQYIEHPGQRVAEALLRNQDLIVDIEKQRELKIKHHQRLQNNLNLSRNIDQLISNITKLQGEVNDRSNQRT